MLAYLSAGVQQLSEMLPHLKDVEKAQDHIPSLFNPSASMHCSNDLSRMVLLLRQSPSAAVTGGGLEQQEMVEARSLKSRFWQGLSP